MSEFPKTPIDGMPGRVTWRRLQVFLRSWGYEGPIDGRAGLETWKAMERFANSIDTDFYTEGSSDEIV